MQMVPKLTIKHCIRAIFEPTPLSQAQKCQEFDLFDDFDLSFEIASITLILILES